MKQLPLCKVKMAYQAFRKGQMVRPPAGIRTWLIAKGYIYIVPEGTLADPPRFPPMQQSVKNAMTKKQRAKYEQTPKLEPKKNVEKKPTSAPPPEPEKAADPETVTSAAPEETSVSVTVGADEAATTAKVTKPAKDNSKKKD